MNSEIEVVSINSAFPPPPIWIFMISGISYSLGFFCQDFMDESAPSPIFKNSVVRVPGMYHTI